MNDQRSPEDGSEPVQPSAAANAPKKVKFTKEPQPELPLADRKAKAGWTRNQIGTWIVVGGFAIVLILIGVVGELTKAR
jgi:hypothetical protein